jgi:hypothetical protein
MAKKILSITLLALLLFTTTALAVDNTNETVKTAEDYMAEYDSLTEHEKVRDEVFKVFLTANSQYDMAVDWADIDEWAEDGSYTKVFWSKTIFESVLTDETKIIRELLEEINGQGNLTELELAVLGMAKEMHEAAALQPGLDDLGQAALNHSKKKWLDPEAQEYHHKFGLEVYNLYLDFKEEISKPLPWPQSIDTDSDHNYSPDETSQNPDNMLPPNNISSGNKKSPAKVSPFISITGSFVGMVSYYSQKKKKEPKEKKKSKEEIITSAADTAHTIASELVKQNIREVEIDGKILTVGPPGFRLGNKLLNFGANLFLVTDTLFYSGLDIWQGVKTGEPAGQIAKKAAKTSLTFTLPFYFGNVGAKIGGTIGSAILPGVGTVVGSVVGSVVGGYFGSASANLLGFI